GDRANHKHLILQMVSDECLECNTSTASDRWPISVHRMPDVGRVISLRVVFGTGQALRVTWSAFRCLLWGLTSHSVSDLLRQHGTGNRSLSSLAVGGSSQPMKGHKCRCPLEDVVLARNSAGHLNCLPGVRAESRRFSCSHTASHLIC